MTGLNGIRVLLVEDDGLVAMMVEGMLEDLGCSIAGTVGSVARALERVEQGDFDLALLDVTLSDGEVYPVADKLAAGSVPFAFASGHGPQALPERFRGSPVAPKPFHLDQLEAALSKASGLVSGGRA